MSNFDLNKYKQQYNKEHYKTFKVDIRPEEMEKLESYLKEVGLTKAQFLRYCIIKFTNEYDRQSTDTLSKKQ